jgi:hypothetical protein
MLNRVDNPKTIGFKNYGGRGIDVDPRWLDFRAFLADMGEKPTGLTLERVDNNRGYWPDNCVWATPLDQARNSRHSKLTYALAEEMRYMYSQGGITQKRLASRYNISLGHLEHVLRRKAWDKP